VAVLQAALGSNHRPELVKPTRGNMHYSSAWDLRFLRRWQCWCWSSGLWRRVDL
jgi:hypothetical protein